MGGVIEQKLLFPEAFIYTQEGKKMEQQLKGMWTQGSLLKVRKVKYSYAGKEPVERESFQTQNEG